LKEYDQLLNYLFEEWGGEIAIKVAREINRKIAHIQEFPEHYPIAIKRKKVQKVLLHLKQLYFIKSSQIRLRSVQFSITGKILKN